MRKLLVCSLLGISLAGAPAEAQAPIDTLRSLSAASGLYSNAIPHMSPSQAYSEVCFVDGQVLFDIHAVGESTAGGLCVPGDRGWLIERDERGESTWDDAKVACLLDGMRLAEPFEYKYSCRNREAFGLNDMTGKAEWASNFAHLVTSRDAANAGVAAARIGTLNCQDGRIGWVARQADGQTNGEQTLTAYRCVR